MVATRLDGTAIARRIRENIAAEIVQRQQKNPRYRPFLKIIQATYVRMKLKAAQEAGVGCELLPFPESITELELLHQIRRLNRDPAVNGILVQLPLPSHLSERNVTSAVAGDKDVDGFGTQDIGELAKRGGSPVFVPCTPKGVMHLLAEAGVDVAGKSAVVLGRSNIVGGPVSHLLRNADCTVTVCHSKTAGLQRHLAHADIVVAAIGRPQFVKGEWLKEGAVVIDVGTNFVPDATKKTGQRLVGDVDFESASRVASAITPVPGGVGPMTVAMLLRNVVDATDRFFESQRRRRPVPLPLKLKSPVPSDSAISRAQTPKLITLVADEVGIAPHELEPYGAYKAKVDLNLLGRLGHRRDGRYVVVTGITPTPLGEGKSTTTIGLAQALGAHLGRLTFANVRQPSQGPTFGIKGGAAGGGYSQVTPMDEFNLHLTGDLHAVTAANNLLAAALESRMFHEQTQKDGPLYRRLVPVKDGARRFTPAMLRRLAKLGIDKTDPDALTEDEIRRFARLDVDPDTITWRRVLDVNDRHLRGVTVGTAATEKGHTRDTGFDISVASECMAILALSTGLADMRDRLSRMVVATSRGGDAVTCDDLGAAGALTALMRDAIKPNLMQTLEGTPVLVHAGPFANISIGQSSIVADRLALKLVGTESDEDQAGFVVTEAGFDFTMGGERFFNIKCRTSGLAPDVVVVVATVRALKVHGGGPPIAPGAPLDDVYKREDVELVRAGCVNLRKHIANARSFGVPVVVAINRFATDSPAEVAAVREEAKAAGAMDAVLAEHWSQGGAGAVDLARAVVAAAEGKDKPRTELRLTYGLQGNTVLERIEAIAKGLYGAGAVELSELARTKVDTYVRQGYGNLPICIAKTQYSLSHDPELKGAPTGFTVPIRDVRLAAGAGYLYALAADIQTMPGLPTAPGYMNIDVDCETGEIDAFAVYRYVAALQHSIGEARRSGLPYVVVPWHPVAWLSQLSHGIWTKADGSDDDVDCSLMIPDMVYRTGFDNFKRHGDAFLLVWPNGMQLKTANAELNRQITQRRDHFPKWLASYSILRQFGENVVTAEGPVWRLHRKTTAGCFNERNAALVFREAVLQTQGMMRNWRSGPLRCVDRDTMRLALNIIAYVGFGLRLPWPGQKLATEGLDPRLARYASLEPPAGHRMSFVDTMACVMDNVVLLLLMPKWLLRAMPFQRTRAAACAYDDYIRYMDELMADKEEEAERQIEGMDLMGHMLRTAYDGKGLTKAEILGNAFIMFVAGHETTANVLHFTMVQLATKPATQRRLQRDIDRLVGDVDPADWDYETLVNGMAASMIGACMNESLRIMPPATELPKEATANQDQPVTMDGQRYLVPKGAIVALAVVSVGLNPRYWPHEESRLFRPERGAFIPFSDGARSCLGRRIAQVEVLAALAVLFREYSLELDVGDFVEDEGEGEDEVERMSRPEKRRVYGFAQERSRRILAGARTMLTLKLHGGQHVPLRMVKRGEERFVSWIEDE
ncbi:hypothetical protein CP533_5178 [Ophiocordyceps camponoti-saundersi (nom. inval.)]|nr:hypothetical protein CP533_5178 [Ophiocordyceps camponoti-saundersi (nom. inval.)]